MIDLNNIGNVVRSGGTEIERIYAGDTMIWELENSHIYEDSYLTFTANAPSTIRITGDELRYKKTNMNYYDINENGGTIYLSNGEAVKVYGRRTADIGRLYIYIEGDVAISGNIMSLIDESLPDELPYVNTFTDLFSSSTGITDISGLILPAQILTFACYAGMFHGCTSLENGSVKIYGEELDTNCCYDMFGGCTSLTIPPELPATMLARGCYMSMFYGCSSLTTAPKLPATTLDEGCYISMFENCTSLKSLTIALIPSQAGWGYSIGGMLRNVATRGTIYIPSSLYNNTQAYDSYDLILKPSGSNWTIRAIYNWP